MKLIPVKLYTVNYYGASALDESAAVWAETAEEAARTFVGLHPAIGASVVMTMHPDGDQSFRIESNQKTALGGWVEGPPPIDGNRYVVRLSSRSKVPFAVVTSRVGARGDRPYESYWDYHDADGITHHLPTPIVVDIL